MKTFEHDGRAYTVWGPEDGSGCNAEGRRQKKCEDSQKANACSGICLTCLFFFDNNLSAFIAWEKAQEEEGGEG